MRALLHRLATGACAALALLLSAPPNRAAPPQAERVVMGVRVDARPFIWRDGGTGHYLGFLWDVCTDAVQRAGYGVTEVEVTAATRDAFLNEGTGGYDLLCDPTTMTLERSEKFATGGPDQLAALRALVFSPIIFVANASFVAKASDRNLPVPQLDPPLVCQPPPAPGRTASDGESPDATTASASAEPSWLERQERNYRFTLRPRPKTEARKYVIFGYVRGSTSAERLERKPPTDETLTICLRAMPSHAEAAAAFCNDQLDRYYGDLDIVREAIAGWNRDHDGTCVIPPRTGAAAEFYEPYAFVVSSGRLHDFPERFTLALYGMFSDGTIERLFNGHFKDAPRSPYLDTLFRLNSIPSVAAGAPNIAQEAGG